MLDSKCFRIYVAISKNYYRKRQSNWWK